MNIPALCQQSSCGQNGPNVLLGVAWENSGGMSFKNELLLIDVIKV